MIWNFGIFKLKTKMKACPYKYHRRTRKLDVGLIIFTFIFLLMVCFMLYYFLETRRMNPLRNSPQRQHPWWKTSVIYEIYPRSFKDSNGDGIGDLRGIISKLDYIKDLGIGAIWLTPIYPSPMVDFGYDVTNYIDIDPIFGSLEDFDELLSELKTRDIKLILDFVPNHTSNLHPWFEKSIKKIKPYDNYYIWKDPKGLNKSGYPIPPNNWLSVQGSTWEWNEERQQFYLHHYEKEQPDLNVRFDQVVKELDSVIKFWLDRGVDGIRLDAISRLFEVQDVYQDEPIDQNAIGKVNPDYRSYLKQIYTTNQRETFNAIRHWRRIVDGYKDRLIMAEVSDRVYQVMRYYGTEEEPLAHFPFNFYFIQDIKKPSQVTGNNLKRVIDKWLNNIPEGKWPNWVLGNHDVHRLSSRMGKSMIDSMNMLSLLLKGTPVTYYGEEIGMEDTLISFEEAVDPRGVKSGRELYLKVGRDQQRTPMQWDSSPNAGFSKAVKTWLPVNKNYKDVNVAAQLDVSQSHLNVYKSLTKLRRKKVFSHGHFEYCSVSDDILAFVRYLEGEDSYLIVINTSSHKLILNLSHNCSFPLPSEGTIAVRASFDSRPETQPGSLVALNYLLLLPHEGVVISIAS